MYDYYEHFGADLTLCGDTHGEVVRLPLIGPLYVNGWIFPKITSPDNPLYDKGLFPYENGNMYITSGIGNYPFPARFCNRPEIVSITILPETKNPVLISIGFSLTQLIGFDSEVTISL